MSLFLHYVNEKASLQANNSQFDTWFHLQIVLAWFLLRRYQEPTALNLCPFPFFIAIIKHAVLGCRSSTRTSWICQKQQNEEGFISTDGFLSADGFWQRFLHLLIAFAHLFHRRNTSGSGRPLLPYLWSFCPFFILFCFFFHQETISVFWHACVVNSVFMLRKRKGVLYAGLGGYIKLF